MQSYLMLKNKIPRTLPGQRIQQLFQPVIFWRSERISVSSAFWFKKQRLKNSYFSSYADVKINQPGSSFQQHSSSSFCCKHNLTPGRSLGGLFWFCYKEATPQKTKPTTKRQPTRNSFWNSLNCRFHFKALKCVCLCNGEEGGEGKNFSKAGKHTG